MRSLLFALLVAGLLMAGATFGLTADSRAAAEVTPSDMGYDRGQVDSQAEAELMDAAFFYIAEWVSAVSVWSYDHPLAARAALLNAPLILMGVVAFRYGAHGALVLYVLWTERRARREEKGL